MLTAAQRKKKRIALIAVWVIYSIAASLFLFHLAREKTSDKAQEDLYVQADSIAAQIPSVLENSLYCEISSLKMKTAKPKVRYERRTDKESLLRTQDRQRRPVTDAGQIVRTLPCTGSLQTRLHRCHHCLRALRSAEILSLKRTA